MIHYVIISAYGDCGHEIELITPDKIAAQKKFDELRLSCLDDDFDCFEELDEAWELYMSYTDKEEYWLLEWVT